MTGNMEKEREGIQANNNYMEQISSAQWRGKEGGPHEGWEERADLKNTRRTLRVANALGR